MEAIPAFFSQVAIQTAETGTCLDRSRTISYPGSSVHDGRSARRHPARIPAAHVEPQGFCGHPQAADGCRDACAILQAVRGRRPRH